MKSLAGKPGLRSGMEISLLGAPTGYPALLGPVSEPLFVHAALPARSLAWLQVFTGDATAQAVQSPAFVAALQPIDQLWISWRKGQKAVGALNEDHMRDLGLAHKMVDVKVLAVDAVWSDPKFVIRLRHRGEKRA